MRAVVVLVPFAPCAARAQDATPLELRGRLRDDAIARPRLAGFGDVTSCTLVHCNQTASLGFEARIGDSFRVAAGGTMQQRAAPFANNQLTLARVDAFYDRGPVSAWLGRIAGARTTADFASADARPGMEYGTAYRWGRVGIAANLGSGTARVTQTTARPSALPAFIYKTDSRGYVSVDTENAAASVSDGRWSSAEGRLSWTAAHWWLAARVGRVALTSERPAFWVGLQLGAEVGRGASLLIGAGSVSPIAAATMPISSRTRLSLGLSFNTAVLSGSSHEKPTTRATAASRAFTVTRVDAGRYRIAIQLPSAHSVEFASDVTGWQPVAMTQTGSVWEVDVAAAAGRHEANVRIDGGGWIAPPGLTATDDDFSGEVGIFSIQ